MAKDDNLLAGIAGFTKGLGDVLVPFYEQKFKQEAELRKEKAKEISVKQLKAIPQYRGLFEGIDENITFPQSITDDIIKTLQQKEVFSATETGLTSLGKVPIGATVLQPNIQTLVTPAGEIIKTGGRGETLKVVTPKETSEDRIKRITDETKAKLEATEKYKKRPIPRSQLESMIATENTIDALNKLISDVKSKASSPDPTNIGYYDLPGSDLYRQLLGSTGQESFKSDVTDLQATYVTAKTGAQRGFKEMQWLAPAMPRATETTKNFLATANAARLRMLKNYQNMYKILSKQGYNIEDIRSTNVSIDTESLGDILQSETEE